MLSEVNQKLNLSEIGLVLSIFLSPLRCYGFIIAGFNFSLFRIAGLFMIITYVLEHHFKIRYDEASKWLGLIAVISIAQSLYSPSLSGLYSNFISITFGFVWAFFAYAVVLDNPDLKIKIIKIFPYSAIIPILIGLQQWIGYQTIGTIPSLPFQMLVSGEGKTGLTFNVYARITSCFGDPAYFSTFAIICFSVTAQIIITRSIIGLRLRNIVISIGIMSLLIIEILMSLSVSGIVGLAIAFCLLIIMNSHDKDARKMLGILVVSIVLIITIYLYKTDFSLINTLMYKTSNSGQSGGNLFGRREYIYNALDKIIVAPFTGVGFGGLSINGSFSSAHSSLLTVLGQQGVFVLLMHITVLIIYPVRTYICMRFKMNKEMVYSKCFLIATLSVLCLTFMYDTLYSLDTCYVLVACGLISRLYTEENEEDIYEFE